MRFQPSTTPFPHFFDEKNNVLLENQTLTSSQKEELLTWVRHNVTIGTHPHPGLNLTGPCWDWKGAIDRNTKAARFHNHAAHSFIFRLLNDLSHIPPHLLGRISHACHNPRCVNPDHCTVQTGRATRTRKLFLETPDPQPQAQPTADPTQPHDTTHANTDTPKPPSGLKLVPESTLNEIRKAQLDIQEKQRLLHEQQRAIQALIQKLVSEVGDIVTAELVRSKFDELVAKAVKR
jgi:hypothetical protein